MSVTIDQVSRAVGTLVEALPKKPQGQNYKQLVNIAWTQCYQKLAEKGLSYMRGQATVLSIPAGTTVLSETSSPALPAAYAPIRLWERPSGSTTWTEMEPVQGILPPNAVQSSQLQLWNWSQQQLLLIGSTAITDLLFEYKTKVTELSMPHDTLSIPDLIYVVAWLVAAEVAAINERPDLADRWDRKANSTLSSIANFDIQTDDIRNVNAVKPFNAMSRHLLAAY